MHMKIPFGFGGKSGKKVKYQDYNDEEYMEDEYIEEYSEEEYEGDYEESYEEEYDEEYVEDAEYIEEEYVEEYYEEEYSEITYEEEAPVIIPFEEDELYEELEYEEEEEEEEEDDDEGGLFGFDNLGDFADKLVMFGGAAVLLIGLIVGGFFLFSKMNTEKEDDYLNVGNQLAQIEVIGGSGLLAVSDAQKAAIEAAAALEEEEESKEYEEQDYNTDVVVKLSMASIEKDLKIKFVNQNTGKLVGNVPFSIQVTGPDGKETMWSDDDMDGIIYKKNLKAGKYKISVNDFEEEKYKKFGLPTGEMKAEVKANIEYKKVDVANEVKSESQVDVKKEDTKINETEVESYLTDTVGWVESTATLVTYAEVAKDNIVNPLQLVMNTDFVKLSADQGMEGTTNPEPTPSAEPTPTPSAEPTPTPSAEPTPTPSESPSPSPSPEVSESPSPSPEVSESPSPSPEVSESPSPSPEVSESPSPEPSESPLPTPSMEPITIALDRKTAVVYVDDANGEPMKLTVIIKPEQKDVKYTIEAKSSDTNILKIKSIKDNLITLEGISAGTATVEVTCKAELKVKIPGEDGEKDKEETLTTEAKAQKCTVEVKANPKKDTKTVLKDNQGRVVYVQENNTYREAHYADYYSASKFFVKGDAKYTGWQTLNGKRYYYTSNGKAVTGEQVIQGVKYKFASDGSLVTGSGTLGIDVSKWNGNIDWKAVKKSGVSYVIIRCGYRGSSQGALIKDSKFETNIKGAIDAGLKVGVYFFSQAVDKNEAVEEASMVLECIKNYKISYPIFLDVEPSGGRADGISTATRTEICKTFCETIQSYGYTAGIYANKNWFTEKINTSELSGKYKIWLAQYAAEPTYTGRYDMWQYKSTGKISGISGDVDMNLSYLGY